MRKRISLKTRRPDRSRAEFRRHYEEQHVPLGLTFVHEFRWRRYVRNHVRRELAGRVGFDCYAEFWVDTDYDDARLDAFVRSNDFQRLNEDDERFLDIRKRLAFDVEEHVVVPRESKLPPKDKLAICWCGRAERALDGFGLARQVVDRVGARVVGATLDRASTMLPDGAPFDTLLSIWLDDVAAVDLRTIAPPLEQWAALAIDEVETPRERLWSGPDVDGLGITGAGHGEQVRSPDRS